jgi:hypothetical protein
MKPFPAGATVFIVQTVLLTIQKSLFRCPCAKVTIYHNFHFCILMLVLIKAQKDEAWTFCNKRTLYHRPLPLLQQRVSMTSLSIYTSTANLLPLSLPTMFKRLTQHARNWMLILFAHEVSKRVHVSENLASIRRA